MNFRTVIFLFLTHVPIHANEALDVLEGKIDARSVILPPRENSPAGEEEDSDEEAAGELFYAAPEWSASPLDGIWSRAVLYDSTANACIQHLAVMGYFDGRATFGEAEPGNGASGPTNLDATRVRRARLGARVRAFYNTEIEAVGEFAGSDRSRGIERLKGYTQVTERTGITYGKFQPFFGAESRREEMLSPFPGRAALRDQIAPAPLAGVSIHHATREYDFDLGWFSSDFDPDFPSLRGDGLLALGVSKSILERSGSEVSQITWRADYLHNFDAGRSDPQGYDIAGRNSENGGQTIVRNPAYRHLFSTGMEMEGSRHSLIAEFQYAKGGSAVWGLTAGGSYRVIPGTLDLVARYQYAGSGEPGGIVAQPTHTGGLRYDPTPFHLGDAYHSFYLGANLHLYKDSIILQNGIEYSIIKDEAGAGFDSDAFTFSSGAQISF